MTPLLALGHIVDLGMECWGVTVSRESIYISSSESGEAKIGIYDLPGKEKRIIGPYNGKDGKVVIKRPLYIAVSNDEKLYASGGSTTPTVFCLESSGNVLYTVSNPLFKGIYLSKALTCIQIFLYKQELLFCLGDGYFWPYCCMNNLYISHISLYAPTYNF